MIRYSSYKDSGVEWIGEIPEHWKQIKLKHQFKIQKGKIPTILYDEFKDGLIPYLSMDVLRGSSSLNFTDANDGIFVSRHQILILWDGSNSGEIIKIENDGILSSTMGVLNTVNCYLNNEFSFYQLKYNEAEIRNNTNGMGIPHVDGGYVRNLPLFVPPLHEQEQIVAYLDKKTAIVDTLIASKVQKINLLKENRTALINHVITKGLNPNVKLKDSGVEWIGEIPEHWEVGKLNFYCERIGDGLHSTPNYDDNGDFFFINGNNIKNRKIIFSDNTRKVNKEEFDKYFIKLSTKQTLLLSINGTIGNLSYYNDEKVILGKSVCYINLKTNNLKIDFLHWFLYCNSIQKYFQFELTGTTIFNLSLNTIRKCPLVIPIIQEQQQIVEYLNTHTQEIDELISLEEKKIVTLKEYRQALISEVVTGKIKVV